MQNPTIQSTTNPSSLTANPDRFSEDAWALLLSSESEARRWRHEYLDVEHILQVLFTDSSYRSTIASLPIDDEEVLNRIENFLATLPITVYSGSRPLLKKKERFLQKSSIGSPRLR